MSALTPRKGAGPEVVAHHLRLSGLVASAESTSSSEILVTNALVPSTMATAQRVEVVLQPSTETLSALGVERIRVLDGPRLLRFPASSGESWSTARTLHPVDVYQAGAGCEAAAVVDDDGGAGWVTVQKNGRTYLLIGSDLGADFCRYRQGDPARASDRHTAPMWGIPGERPFYLFDQQQPEGSENDRQADWWSMALATIVAALLGRSLPPILPHDAPGAIVVTGDDDQAYLEKYREQLELLDGVPITYFLHPLTRHTPDTLAQMGNGRLIECGLHPDALDEPANYSEIFRRQAEWFQHTYGIHPGLVRNHGFLNDGYWGHLPAWLDHKVRVSANLPGVNGRILNGSLMPARVAAGDTLTPHWSILTAIGDGVRFALGADGPQSAKCIVDLADRIEASRLPGVIVLNLHPQNVAETAEMHAAVHTVIAKGFVAMTLGECIDWFDARDRAV
jgi:hypothetical protein